MRHWVLAYDSSTRFLFWVPLALLLLTFGLIGTFLWDPSSRRTTSRLLAWLAFGMFLVQPYLALVWAPPEQYMGNTGRIIYMHVPTQWVALLALTVNFACSVAFLFKKNFDTDALAQASAEIGLVLGTLGLITGSIWAKPTWGTWWTWDPRLVTEAILVVIYMGYLAMRRFVEDPEKRATWAAVMGIIGFVDIPVLWFSVKWWRSMHQVQSNTQTIDPVMRMVWTWSAAMFLAVTVVWLYQRFLLARETQKHEVALPSTLPDAQEA